MIIEDYKIILEVPSLQKYKVKIRTESLKFLNYGKPKANKEAKRNIKK